MSGQDYPLSYPTVPLRYNLEVLEYKRYIAGMPWTVVLVDEVADWYLDLVQNDLATAEQVETAIDFLADEGPALGRPIVDTISGSSVRNLKELRPGSKGRSEIRILFVFDPARQAVLLVAGDKAGDWSRWYRVNIPVAEQRYAKWLAGGYAEERGA